MSDAAKTREVADGVVQVFLPLPMRPTIVNVYLVRAGDGWTLVDTGMHTGDSLAAFRGALAEIGIAPTDIRRIVCTHHHVDHYGTSGPLRDLTRAEVHLHPAGSGARRRGARCARRGCRVPAPQRHPAGAAGPADAAHEPHHRQPLLPRDPGRSPRRRRRAAARRRAPLRRRVDARPHAGTLLPAAPSPTASSSSATICCRRSRRTSASDRTAPPTRWATSWRRTRRSSGSTRGWSVPRTAASTRTPTGGPAS